MSSRKFKYDVAFSFVQQDEQLALQIADRIRDRINVFVYTERQEAFAGTDGVDEHMRIYEHESRLVVVLHREDWARTEWTRVEETAIRNRGYSEGYDFLVFVPLNSSAEKPKWLPKIEYGSTLIDSGLTDSLARLWQRFKRKVEQYVGNLWLIMLQELAVSLTSLTRNGIISLHTKGLKLQRTKIKILFGEFQRLVEEVNSQCENVRLWIDNSDSDVRVLTVGIRFAVTSRLILESLRQSKTLLRFLRGW